MRSALALAGITMLASSGLVVTATSASAAPPPTPGPALVTAADAALKANARTVKASTKDRYAVHSSKRDANGGGVVRYSRTYDGLRVHGGDFVIRTEADGDFAGSSVGLAAPLSLGTTPKVSAERARKAATAEFSGKITGTGPAELFVDASSGTGRLAWETVVAGWAPDGQTPSKLHVISDALTGSLIGSYDEVESVVGTGNSVYAGPVVVDTTQSGSTYSLVDPTRGSGRTCDMNNGTSTCTTFTDADNVWGNGTVSDRQSAAVDAHFGAAKTFDYFKNVHGRNGIFGNGTGVPSRVHYGNAYVNAFWDGAQMTYGDGAGNTKPLVSLDVAGHEMSHGVTANVVPGGLTYSGESGGLNEATSDIFGNMVEFYANTTADPGDYEVGEKIDIRGTGVPLRYMYNPTLDGSSHGCWSTSTNSIDVHYSSGPANHFFFNLAVGTGATPYGNSPLCGSAPPVTGIGREKAEKIWFRALDVYFVSNTRYVNTAQPTNTARLHTLSAATDLYGLCSTEYKAVQAAWTAVNVVGSESCADNDFSVSVAPATVTVDPGTSATATVGTTVVRGTAEQVTFSTGPLPAGVTVSFNPPSVTAGGSTTLTVSASATAGSGSFAITVVGTSPSVARTTTLSLTVNGLPGCSGTNGTDVPIADNTTVESTIVISGCAATPSTASKVEVHIVHTYIGDLVVSLVAPDGSTYVLHNRTGSSTDNIDQIYTVNLSTEAANGSWRLRVQDAASLDTGYLNSWTLTL
ncbi:M4 family metallopeptidase [Micromonospora sp. NPDC092111]|uniref:M4 family metallopeptidase n=1 Tax=Micromonospora sp. NPDC092111 TaxID=3364289 RepID=UPI0038151EEB